MRGTRKLQKSTASIVDACGTSRIEKRNYKMAWRFFYYDTIKRLRYEDTLERLAEEFYISRTTAASILMKSDTLAKINTQRPNPDTVIHACKPYIAEISAAERKRYIK